MEDALDFITHAIEELAIGLFFQHGFTAHRAALIQFDPTATSNLYDRHPVGVADLLDPTPPVDFIANVLRVAKSSDEVDQFVHRYEQAAAGTPSSPTKARTPSKAHQQDSHARRVGACP